MGAGCAGGLIFRGGSIELEQIHRWLSIAFTAGVIVNFVAVAKGKYSGRGAE